ncbi:MAP-ous protein 1 like [Verticillium longisporum]|nr:MAP-ous protein 1 like [Verticillium longisporum]
MNESSAAHDLANEDRQSEGRSTARSEMPLISVSVISGANPLPPCISMIENGVNPEALATVVKELRKEAQEVELDMKAKEASQRRNGNIVTKKTVPEEYNFVLVVFLLIIVHLVVIVATGIVRKRLHVVLFLSRETPRSSPASVGSDAPSPTTPSSPVAATNGSSTNGHNVAENGALPKPIPTTRPGVRRTESSEKPGPNGTPPHRRNSWFSSISSKFSSSPNPSTTAPSSSPIAQQPQTTPPKDTTPAPPKAVPSRNAVLQHATKPDGDLPYTPAPPSRGQSSFLGVFRRLSSSGGALHNSQRGNHGLVERKILNVDRNRERCAIAALHQAKLRRVAFSVDVEIAPMPKYTDAENGVKSTVPADKSTKQKLTEKGEGEALKNPKTIEEQKEQEGVVKATGEQLPKEPEKEGSEVAQQQQKQDVAANAPTLADKEREARKKEKKKKSEEERKARKEKKRKLAEANGTVPMEIHLDDSDSSGEVSPAAPPPVEAPKTTAYPTTNPVRIYRRCCQLRETPILKRITEQLNDPANLSSDVGVVEKLDLTGYWMQLPDLITLGDYLAVVPVKEVILENCGLSDEGLRVILAGLLAARRPESRRRKQVTHPEGLTRQGGVVERLVLKNNKLGVDGWKHTCLFIYLCRTLRHLDLSMVPLPRPVSPKTHPGHRPLHLPHLHHQPEEITLASLFSKAVGQRLAGSTLELLHIGGIEPTSEELGTIIDGVIECGVKRLGLAHNNIDDKGLEHVARWVTSGNCVGLDLGGNDLRENLEVFANAITSDSPLWGLSLAECNLRAGTLCKILPKLVPLDNFRFIDLSHNQDLCRTEPSAISLLRKYLPKLENLRRIHLADVAMSSEQAIALAEILPEVQNLAHISFLENPDLVNLADAQTEESQEEACALYASLLAATRVSNTMVCVDIDVPSERSGEIVKAMAKQVVAYCLRNLQRFPIAEISSAVQALSDGQDAPAGQDPPYPDVLAHLVGHDVLNQYEVASDDESAPDDDYVIGGTGVVKALTCCLKNRGDESRRQSGEFIREVEGGITLPAIPQPRLPHGKAKVMSKHLLASARKIRVRLQPAIARAKNNASDEENYRKLMFLDTTLANIIKRFEDEFPDTRVDESTEQAVADAASAKSDQLGTSLSSELDPEQIAIPSDPEDDLDLQVRPSVSRSNSIMSHTSRALADEEGRILRAGHKFRSGIIKPEHYGLLNSPDELSFEPKHEASMLDMVEELDDPALSRKAKEKGIIRLFREDRVEISEALRRVDPEYWERFVESQEKARGNVQVSSVTNGAVKPAQGDESAVVDDA